MTLSHRTWAIGAQPMGAPGWPELAFWTMSAVRQRTVLMHFQLMSLLSNLGSNFWQYQPSVPHVIARPYVNFV